MTFIVMRRSRHALQCHRFQRSFCWFSSRMAPKVSIVGAFAVQCWVCCARQATSPLPLPVPYPRAVVLTSLSTFSSQVLYALCAPGIGAVLNNAPIAAPPPEVVSFAACQLATLAVSALFTAAQRRHLMAWSIFVPKLTFELAACALVLLFTPVIHVLYAGAPR